MSVRADLLELTPEALTALANAGFVKRAQKDAEAGLLPALEMAVDGTVTAAFDDGVRTVLPPGRTLRDAACSCSASGMCRHRVMLVLAYQAQTAARSDATKPTADAESAGAWSPTVFDDAALAASFAPSVLDQAHKLAAARPAVKVQAWRSASMPPTVELPMCSVRFFSRSSLAHARCDCKQGSGCAHVVLALWAFLQAEREQPGLPEATVELRHASATDSDAVDERPTLLQGASAQALVARVEALLLSLWLEGSGQPLMALAARFEVVRSGARALGWRWVEDEIDELWQLLQAQQARSSRFDPLRLLRVQADLWARLRAAAHADQPAAKPRLPARQILGVGVQGEVALDHLRLVSLGAELWSDETAEGARVLFADPDTQTVTVLEREWPRAVDARTGAPAASVATRRVAGQPLRQLAAGQVITKNATRRANGLIDITAGVRQTGVLPLSPKSWDELVEPLRQRSVAALAAHLRATPPDFVRPGQAAGGVSGALHVLAFHAMAVHRWHWDATAQVLHAWVGREMAEEGAEAKDRPFHLALPHRAAAPGAVDALARVLTGEYGPLRAVAGMVRLDGGEVLMQPLALLTAQRAVVPQVEAAAPQSLALQADHAEWPPLAALARDTLDLLAQWLRQGLRHQGGSVFARADAQAARLQQAGLNRAAELLRSMAEGMRANQPVALLARLALLVLLVQGIAR
jgi:hypothetical protein